MREAARQMRGEEASPMATKTQKIETGRREWLAALRRLTDQVAAWADARDWSVDSGSVALEEELLGAYQAPSLTVATDWGPMLLEPVACLVAGADGRVDLFAYPSMYRVTLLLDQGTGEWKVRTDSGLVLKEPWDAETFAWLARGLHAE